MITAEREQLKQYADQIDLSMTWQQALRVCLTVIANGNVEGKNQAIGQLMQMAKAADLLKPTVELLSGSLKANRSIEKMITTNALFENDEWVLEQVRRNAHEIDVFMHLEKLAI